MYIKAAISQLRQLTFSGLCEFSLRLPFESGVPVNLQECHFRSAIPGYKITKVVHAS